VKSLGGASRLSTTLCNPGSLEWVDTQSVPQPSRCFNGLYTVELGTGVAMLYTANQSPMDIELSISGTISPAVASASENRTVVAYDSCQWRGYRVSTCGATSSVHHMLIFDTSASPLLNLTAVSMDNSQDDLTISGIGPGTAIIVLTFATTGANSCLPEDVYRKIFYQAIRCTALPGQAAATDGGPAGGGGGQGQAASSCVEDPYGIIGGQTCAGTLSAVISFGSDCNSPMTDLSMLFRLVGIDIPADKMGSSFAEICPVACDACPSAGASPPPPSSPAPPLPAPDPDCIDDRDGALLRAHQNCEELISSARQMGQVSDCTEPLSQLSMLFGVFGIVIDDGDLADGTVDSLCPIACGVCVGTGSGGHR
jgi:hypothetical protein